MNKENLGENNMNQIEMKAGNTIFVITEEFVDDPESVREGYKKLAELAIKNAVKRSHGN